MKELSIEEKAKRYDEAYKKVAIGFGSNVADEIFSGFRESEDERIKNEIIAFIEQSIHRGGGTPIPQEQENKWIAWLEKQGKQKHIVKMKSAEESLGIDFETYNKIVDECIYGENKPADKVEPKFHKGDWVVYDYRTYQVVELPKESYTAQYFDESDE